MSLSHKNPIALKPVTSRPYLSTNNNEWSQHQLLTLRKSIEESSQTNTQVREQLKMQRQNSNQFLSQICSSMLTTEQSGVDLIAKFQEEKCKHQQLTHLVHHYQNQISSQKKQQHQKLLQNIQTNQYDQLNIDLGQKQKLLQTITNKLNLFQSQTMSRYEVVKAERRERTVFSNQFNQFQNDMFSLEEKYKQLVIERTLLEKDFDLLKGEFIRLQNNILKKAQLKEIKDKSLSPTKYQRDSEPLRLKNPAAKTTLNNYRFEIKQSNSHYPNILSFQKNDWQESYTSRYKRQQGLDWAVEPSWMKSRSRLMRVQKNESGSRQSELNERKLVNLDYKKKVQVMLNDLGLANTKQLKGFIKGRRNDIDNYILDITKSNQKRFQNVKQLQQTISQWQQKIKQLKFTIQSFPLKPKRTKSQKNLHNHINAIKNLIQNTTHDLNSIHQDIINFSQSKNFTFLITSLGIHLESPTQQGNDTTSFDIDSCVMSQIQQKLFALIDTIKCSQTRPKHKLQNPRDSFLLEPVFTHSLQKQSLIHTQKSICPLLSPPSNIRKSKRVKTNVYPASDFQPIKKLSNLLRNQSRFKGPVDVASKEQLISQATESFGKEGIFRQDKFYVNYS